MTDYLRIYVLPVSGGEFPVQLGLLSEVYEAYKILNKPFKGYRNYAPDIVCAASGGNIAAYLAMSGDWSTKGINQSVTYLECNMFIYPWMPLLPTWCAAFFTGSLYRSGYGIYPIFRTFFTPLSIQRTEIWTGTFNTVKSKAQFFCNKSMETSLIQENCNEDLYCLMDLQYLDGNIKKISDATTASASVPILTQSHNVNKVPCQDGGVLYGSTLIPLSDSIRNVINNECKQLQLIYFCSYDMEKNIGDSTINMSQPIQALIHSNILKDRNASVDLLRSICCSELIHTHKKYLSTCELSEIILKCESFQHFVIILYPSTNKHIDMTNFTQRDIYDSMSNVKSCYSAYIWTSFT